MTGKLKSFAAYYNDQESPEIIEAVDLDEAEDIALERCGGLKGVRPQLGKGVLASSSFVKYAIYDNDRDPADTPEYLTGGHVERDPEEPPCPEQIPGHGLDGNAAVCERRMHRGRMQVRHDKDHRPQRQEPGDGRHGVQKPCRTPASNQTRHKADGKKH